MICLLCRLCTPGRLSSRCKWISACWSPARTVTGGSCCNPQILRTVFPLLSSISGFLHTWYLLRSGLCSTRADCDGRVSCRMWCAEVVPCNWSSLVLLGLKHFHLLVDLPDPGKELLVWAGWAFLWPNADVVVRGINSLKDRHYPDPKVCGNA